MADPAVPQARSPQSPAEIFTVFTRLALQGFGGVLPVAQRTLVERHGWLDREQFLELLSISQVLPGPNIVNLALIFGDRHFGWRGAVAATTGILLAPLLLVLVLAVLARQFQDVAAINNALRGMGAVVAGLVLSTAIKLAGALRKNALGWPLCAAFVVATVLAIAGLRWPLVGVILGLGSIGIALAWRRLPGR